MHDARVARAPSASGDVLFPTDNCRFCRVGGRVVVLNLRTGRYHVLGVAAAHIWTLAVNGARVGAIVESVQMSFGVDPRVAARDVTAFLKTCTASTLLSPHAADTSAARLPAPRRQLTTFVALGAIFGTRRTLRIRGFPAAYARQRQFRRAEGVADISLSAALRVFSRAENFFSVGNAGADCLPRSLALHRFLLSAGFEAAHVLGVRCDPFAAHAWVEVNGGPVCDSTSHVARFTPIARIEDAPPTG